MPRNRRAVERASRTAEPYQAALEWVNTHPGVALVPAVAGEQAALEHDLHYMLSGHPQWPFVVRWVVADPDAITVHLDADHAGAALAAILPHHSADTRLAGIPGVRAAADGDHVRLTRGTATARLMSTAHLSRHLDGLRGPGALWYAGTAVSVTEQMALDSPARPAGTFGSESLRHIGEAHRDYRDGDATSAGEAHYLTDAAPGSGGVPQIESGLGPSGPREIRLREVDLRPERVAAVLTSLDRVSGRPRNLAERIIDGLGGAVVVPALFVESILPLRAGVTVQQGVDRPGLGVRFCAGGWPDGELPSSTIGRLLLILLATQVMQGGGRAVYVPAALLIGPDGPRIRHQLMLLATMRADIDIREGDGIRDGGAHLSVAREVTGEHELTVTLTPEFQAEVLRRPVALRSQVVRALSGKPAALDLYAYLAYRLPGLSQPVLMPWGSAPHVEKGSGIVALLDQVTAVYPQAGVAVTEQGLLLRPSPPAVPRR